MYYIGIDVHGSLFAMCILDHHGKTVKQFAVRGTTKDLFEAVAKLPTPFAVCYEASCGYGYLHDHLARRAQRVVVAHPGQLRLIFRSKRKNDRVDAKKLATLLFLDQVPPVYVPSLDVRSWRQLMLPPASHECGSRTACAPVAHPRHHADPRQGLVDPRRAR